VESITREAIAPRASKMLKMPPKPQDLVIEVEENKSSKDINVVDIENEKKKDKKIINKPLPFHKLLSYADAVDWLLMALGTLGSIIHGTAQPIGYLLLGKALNAFGSNIGDDAAMVKALDKVCIYVIFPCISINFHANLYIYLSIYLQNVYIYIPVGYSVRVVHGHRHLSSWNTG
jgi:hypothetical protein